MCIIVHRPKEATFPSLETLHRCWETNADGAGLMYANGNRLFVVKGFMTFESFMDAVKTIPDGVPATLHFRIGTHGGKTAENTHPWIVVEKEGVPKVAMVHNGMIHGYGDREYSDSRDFAETLAPFGIHGPWNDSLKRLIDGVIGSNKLVFMRSDGETIIYNETLGIKDGGCWYSNSNFRPYVAPIQQTWNVTPWSWQEHSQLPKVGKEAAKGIEKTKTPVPKQVIPANEQVISVHRHKDKVRIKHLDGITVVIAIKAFILQYNDYSYSTYMCKHIDNMVTQWELDLEHEEMLADSDNLIQ